MPTNKRRKRYTRAKPGVATSHAPCGSGRKYKKCHGALSGTVPVPKEIVAAVRAHEAREAVRRDQQGEGRPIISAEVAGHRVVAVGDTLHFAQNQKTFIDFLDTYMGSVLGRDGWGTRELEKPLNDRHPILQWYDAVCRHKKQHAVQPEGEIQSTPVTGLMSAYYGLAYNLYLLKHNAELQAFLIRRLKRAKDFHGAYYETFVAAWFILAGFELALENEEDSTRTHTEFTASRGGAAVTP